MKVGVIAKAANNRVCCLLRCVCDCGYVGWCSLVAVEVCKCIRISDGR